MKFLILAIFFSVLTSSLAVAEFPTKPTHANTSHIRSEKESTSKDAEILTKEESKDPHCRAMLIEKEQNSEKKPNVLNSIKGGRLYESNKQISK